MYTKADIKLSHTITPLLLAIICRFVYNVTGMLKEYYDVRGRILHGSMASCYIYTVVGK